MSTLIVLALVCALAVVALVVFVAVVAGIHSEPRYQLPTKPQRPLAAMVRRLLGVHVSKRADTDANDSREECLTGNSTDWWNTTGGWANDHPPEWLTGEPCPVGGSPDILECQLRIGADKVEMGWECSECGHSVTWTARPSIDEGHVIERRIVEHMPLHAITSLYGERGLRERFATETARLCDPAGRRKTKQALQLAGRLHSLDHRQREPYVNHVLRVALRIIVHYEVHDPDIICAALLHDAVEDHTDDMSPGGRPGAFAILTACFGPRVAGWPCQPRRVLHEGDYDITDSLRLSCGTSACFRNFLQSHQFHRYHWEHSIEVMDCQNKCN